MAYMHLIHFPDPEQHKRAIRALLDVPVPRVGLPDYQMVVTNEHIRALQQSKINFVYLSKTASDDGQPASVQS